MYKFKISTGGLRCFTTPSRVVFSQIKPKQQIRNINIQQTNVSGYSGRGPKAAEKNFSRAEKDRAERALLYAKTRAKFKSQEKQKRKKYPASLLKAEELTEQILEKVSEKNYDEALKIFAENKKAGIQFGTRAYGAALKILSQKKDMDTAAKYFDDLVKEKVPLDVALVDYLLVGFSVQKNLDLVKQYFKKIEELKLTPTVHSYNALLAVVPTAEDITNTILQLKGQPTQPNIQTYVIGIRRFTSLGRFDLAWDLYVEARAHHVPPNASFWVETINSCAKFGQIDYLEKVLVHMVDSHRVTFDYRHWTALVRAYTSMGRWDRLYDMVEEMRKRKAPFDPNIIFAITSSLRASDLVRGYLEFPLNQLHVTAYKEAAAKSPRVTPMTARMFLGLLNDAKPVLLANVFKPPAPVASTTTAATTQV